MGLLFGLPSKASLYVKSRLLDSPVGGLQHPTTSYESYGHAPSLSLSLSLSLSFFLSLSLSLSLSPSLLLRRSRIEVHGAESGLSSTHSEKSNNMTTP